MAIRKYLYREDEEVWKKIDDIKQRHNFTTKDAITYLINKGYTSEAEANAKVPVEKIPAENITVVTPEVP